jgi:intracellular septation protein
MIWRIIFSWTLEFGPVLVFLVAFYGSDFFAATKFLIGATVIALAITFIKQNRVAIFPLITAGMIIAFAGATLWLREPQALIFEVTLYNACFAAMIFIGRWRGRDVFKKLFNGLLALTDKGWKRLELRWGAFFIINAVANEIVRWYFSVNVWVHFRFAMTIAIVVFALSQMELTREERLPEGNAIGLRVE